MENVHECLPLHILYSKHKSAASPATGQGLCKFDIWHTFIWGIGMLDTLRFLNISYIFALSINLMDVLQTPKNYCCNQCSYEVWIDFLIPVTALKCYPHVVIILVRQHHPVFEDNLGQLYQPLAQKLKNYLDFFNQIFSTWKGYKNVAFIASGLWYPFGNIIQIFFCNHTMLSLSYKKSL